MDLEIDLELVPTEDLLEEIMKRFNDIVVIGRRMKFTNPRFPQFNEDAGEEGLEAGQWSGDGAVCIGLAARVIHRINLDLDSTASKGEL